MEGEEREIIRLDDEEIEVLFDSSKVNVQEGPDSIAGGLADRMALDRSLSDVRFLESELEDANRRLVEATDETARLIKELENTKYGKRVAEHRAELAEAAIDCKLSAKTVNVEMENDLLKKRLTAVELEIEVMRKQNEENYDKLKKSEESEAELTRALQKMKEEAANIQLLRSSYNSMQEQLERAKLEVPLDTQKEFAALNTRINELLAENKKSKENEAKEKELTAEIDAMKLILGNRENIIRRITKEREDAQEYYCGLLVKEKEYSSFMYKKTEEKESIVNFLQEKLNVTMQGSMRMADELRVSTARNEELKADFDKLEKDKKEWNKVEAERLSEQTLLKAQLAKSVEEKRADDDLIASLSDSFAKEKEDGLEKDNKISELESNLNELREKSIDAEKEFQTLSEELKSVRGKYEEMKAKAVRFEEEKEEWKASEMIKINEIQEQSGVIAMLTELQKEHEKSYEELLIAHKAAVDNWTTTVETNRELLELRIEEEKEKIKLVQQLLQLQQDENIPFDIPPILLASQSFSPCPVPPPRLIFRDDYEAEKTDGNQDN